MRIETKAGHGPASDDWQIMEPPTGLRSWSGAHETDVSVNGAFCADAVSAFYAPCFADAVVAAICPRLGSSNEEVPSTPC